MLQIKSSSEAIDRVTFIKMSIFGIRKSWIFVNDVHQNEANALH